MSGARGPFILLVLLIGDGFHPDTAGMDYTRLPEGVTPAHVDDTVQAALAEGIDVYSLALAVLENRRKFLDGEQT